MNYSLLADLLPQLEEYQRLTSPDAQGAAHFAAWLAGRYPEAPATPSTPNLYSAARISPSQYESPESLIGKLLTFAYRYMRGYVRQALAGTPLVSFDDFTYLITLFDTGPLTKTELMARNIHEKAAGTEVIKRLLKHGFVSEVPHATDRRSKLLHLTEQGQQLLFRVAHSMEQVAAMTAGDLSPQERQQLVHLLHRLDAFHYPIFAAPRSESFEELARRHFPQLPPPGGPPAAEASGPAR